MMWRLCQPGVFCIGLNLSVWLDFFKIESNISTCLRLTEERVVTSVLQPWNGHRLIETRLLNCNWMLHGTLNSEWSFFPVSVQDLGRRSNDNLISSLRSSAECFCSSLSLKMQLLLMIIGKKVTHVWLLFILHFR